VTRVRITHARQLGYCVPGIRRVCKQHGADFRRFVREGIPADELRSIEDAEVARIIDAAEMEERDG